MDAQPRVEVGEVQVGDARAVPHLQRLLRGGTDKGRIEAQRALDKLNLQIAKN